MSGQNQAQQQPSMFSNYSKYVFTRVLQKMGLTDLQVQVGTRGRSVIPNPPLITKWFTTERGRNRVFADASLRLVIELAKTATNFWDVGANIGLYSILAREHNPDLKVVSIEACTDLYQVLCRNWQVDPQRWICLHLAVGAEQGMVQMTRGLEGCDYVLPTASSLPSEACESRPMMPLDRIAKLLGEDRIDLLKIDVEGMEFAVLKGASDLLDAGKIGTIVLEADEHDARYGTCNAELVAFLASKKYHLDTTASVVGLGEANCQLFRTGAGH
jgi:FkbM family methyltransferase